ncbi:AAA family ATPase [Actinomyces bouchesdurhonensis]|uniref:AAA family ATPase n=1 Tax=Actinomyces bouchesdurhonensis TaxID=1852361 RepID=UPI0028E58150|nr:AAA family ATPase [Actinomyces bouchesdurhonensis]
MIEEVDLSGTPCFAPDTKLTGLKKINFIFGPNGSGKTTLSNSIQAINLNDQETDIEDVAIFNRDYIKEAFRTCQAPGHITLGKQSSTIKDEIDRLNTQLNKEKTTLDELNRKTKEAESEEDSLLDTTRKSIGKGRAKLTTTLKAYNSLFPKKEPLIPGNNATLLTKLLDFASRNKTQHKNQYSSIEDIIEILKVIPEAGATEIPAISPPYTEYTSADVEQLLSSTISISNDSAMSEFIDKYNLQEWISRGLAAVEENHLSTCPFCQQNLSKQLISELKHLFNEEHEAHLKAIQQASLATTNYIDHCSALVNTLTMDAEYKPIDCASPLRIINSALKDMRQIQSKLEHKAIEPNLASSTNVTYDPFQTIDEQVNIIKSQIDNYNKSVNAGMRERRILIQNARFALYEYLTQVEFYNTLNEYKEKLRKISLRKPTNEDIASIQHKMKHTRSAIEEEKSKLSQVGEKMTFINQLLTYIGFTSFCLITPDEAEQATNSESASGQYILVRQNGDGFSFPIDTSTLSEGERTLLTFLYFITKYLEPNNSSVSEYSRPTLLVIDDPIASTDAETFFLITNLIRSLLDDVANENIEHCVKQVIITSHNTRFLKEVAFSFQKHDDANTPAAFYTITKNRNGSAIFGPESASRITNEYNDLWAEVRRCTALLQKADKSKVAPPKFPLLGNTMRRIIDSYFLDIGEKGSLTSLGKSKNKKVSILIAFCNSSSHSAMGSELYDTVNWNPRQLLNAFKEVFETIDDGAHIGHYKMMMQQRKSDHALLALR